MCCLVKRSGGRSIAEILTYGEDKRRWAVSL